MKQYSLLIVISILLLLNGCKSTAPRGPHVRTQEEVRFAHLLKQQPTYNTFTAKLSLDLSSKGNNITSPARLTIVNHKMIDISVRPLLGIEMARLRITTDSIFVIDKTSRRYVAESIATIMQNSTVDIRLNTLQSLLTNRLFTLSSDSISEKSFSLFTLKKSPDNTMLLKNNQPGVIKTFFDINKEDLLQNTSMTVLDKGSLIWNYSRFEKIQNGVFPLLSEVTISTPTHSFGASIGYSDITYNSTIRIEKLNINSYRRVTIDEIITMLTQ